MIWTILACSMAVLAAFCVAVSATLAGNGFFENHRIHIAAAIGVIGISIWMFGHQAARKRTEKEGGAHKFVIFDPRYWGVMVMILATLTPFIHPLKDLKGGMARLQSKPTPAKPAPTPRILTNRVAVFPSVRMQGVILRKDRSFAIIDGNSYTIGDRVGAATVSSIDSNSVTLELNGEAKQLTLK